jgi:putative 4-mercaptohistidine N1-methyltranferase
VSQSDYETDVLLAQYLLLHYGKAEDILPYSGGPRDALDYPVRCVSALLQPGRLPAETRALDVGCAVGRSSFELARHCDEVVGVDLSQRFIDTATALAAGEAVEARCADEGEITRRLVFRAPRPERPVGRICFRVADACALPVELDAFNVVLNANLLDRLPDPGLFLDRLPGLVAEGGQLLFASPFTWLESYTPKNRWVGGTVSNAGPVRSWDALCEQLDPYFTLDFDTELPFLIREHARKFQWSVARAGRWIRKTSDGSDRRRPPGRRRVP